MTTHTIRPLLLLSLIACGEEGKPAAEERAVFASADEAAREAAAVAGIGYLPVLAWLTTMAAPIDAALSENACPAMTENDDGSVTYTADACTGPSGSSYDGSFTATNLPGLFSEEAPEGPMSVRFEGWAADGIEVDGEVWQSEAMPETDYESQADLTLAVPGLPAMAMDAAFSCSLDASGASACSTADATMGVDGLGSYTVDGPWRIGADGLPKGVLTLQGEDSLTLDLGGIDPQTGCIPAAIDGEPVADVCIGGLVDDGGEPGPGPGEEVTIMGSVTAFAGEELENTVWTLGPVESVEAELSVDGSPSELHPVPYVGLNAIGEDTWSLFLAEGEYVAGESTALEPSAHYDAVAVKLRAYDADGNVVACGFSGTVMGDPADYFSWSECP